MSGFDLVIFDCDGVLVDSEILAAKVESKLLTDAGYPIDVETMGERFAGATWKNILLEVEKEANIPLSAQLLDKSEALLDKRIQRELKGIPGVAEAVQKITTKRCICSNSTSKRLEMMLKKTGFWNLFQPHIFSARDLKDGQPKPAPDIFLHGVKEMQANPANTLVIEDSVHGILAAKAAGLRVVGFTGASHTYPGHADKLTDAGAETVINRMRDLPAVVEALAEWSDAG